MFIHAGSSFFNNGYKLANKINTRKETSTVVDLKKKKKIGVITL